MTQHTVAFLTPMFTVCDSRATTGAWTRQAVLASRFMSAEASLIAGYALDQERRGLRPRTIRRRTDVLRNLVRHRPEPILTITVEEIHGWLESVPRVNRTRYCYLSALSSFFCWAITADLVDTNPVAKIPRPKLRPGLPRPMASADVALAAREAPPMIRAWILLGALAGLRCQEIAGMEREHVWDHEEQPMLHVVEGKGGVQRVVPLHPEILAALRMHGLPSSGMVFRSLTTGRPYSPERVSQIGNVYLRSVGVPATMHQLRHRFGTDLYRASRDLRMTQDLMGHASPVTTSVYTAVSPMDAVKVVNGLKLG